MGVNRRGEVAGQFAFGQPFEPIPSIEQIALGEPYARGWKYVHKFGFREGVGSGASEDVQFGVANQILWMEAAEPLRLKAGGDAADDAAGVGAQSLQLMGLDDSGAALSATLATAGASASAPTAEDFTRIFRAAVPVPGSYFQSGAGGSNVGALTVEGATTGNIYLTIPAGHGRSQTTAWTMPAGYHGLLRRYTVNASDSKENARVRLHTRKSALNFDPPYGAHEVIETAFGVTGKAADTVAYYIDELTDVWACALAGGAGGADVEVAYTVIYRAKP